MRDDYNEQGILARLPGFVSFTRQNGGMRLPTCEKMRAG